MKGISKVKEIAKLKDQLKDLNEQASSMQSKQLTEDNIRQMNIINEKIRTVKFKISNLEAGLPILGDVVGGVRIINPELKKAITL